MSQESDIVHLAFILNYILSVESNESVTLALEFARLLSLVHLGSTMQLYQLFVTDMLGR